MPQLSIYTWLVSASRQQPAPDQEEACDRLPNQGWQRGCGRNTVGDCQHEGCYPEACPSQWVQSEYNQSTFRVQSEYIQNM
jgi:hypothetical protein